MLIYCTALMLTGPWQERKWAQISHNPSLPLVDSEPIYCHSPFTGADTGHLAQLYTVYIYILIHWTYYTRAHVEWEVKARSSGTDSAQRAICHISKIYNSVFIVWIREKNDTKRVSIQFIVFSFISFIIDSVVWHEIRKELVFVSHYMHLEIDVFYDSCFVFFN